MADFFDIVKQFQDRRKSSAQSGPRTGGDTIYAAEQSRKAAEQQRADDKARWDAVLQASLASQSGTGRGSSSAYLRPGGSGRVGSPRNEGWGQRSAGGTVEQNRQLARQLAQSRGWTGAMWDAFDRLVMKESGYKHTAQNPTSTAYGIGQFLDSTWKNYGQKTSDPRAQLDYMMRYVADRYRDPIRALQFHERNNWY